MHRFETQIRCNPTMTSDTTPRCAHCGAVDEYDTCDQRANHGDRVYYCSATCRRSANESQYESRQRGGDTGFDADNPAALY